jgi:hypothetical protein
MLAMLSAPQNLVFSAALGVVAILFVIELGGLLIGAQLSETLDGVFDLDPGSDIDASATGLTKALAWLHFGRIPLLMLIVLFLLGFGLSGLIVQRLIALLLGAPASALIATIPALAVATGIVRLGGPLISRIMPQDETAAVSRDSFVGRLAVITTGTARKASPTEARLRDEHGQLHYVMVEPDMDGDLFKTGEEVLIVAADRHLFRVIRNTSAGMTGDSAGKSHLGSTVMSFSLRCGMATLSLILLTVRSRSLWVIVPNSALASA